MPSHASPNDSPSPSILLRPQQIAEHPTVWHWPPAVTWTDQCCGSRHLSQGRWYPKTAQCLCENDKHKSKSLWCLRISPTIKTPTILSIYYILRMCALEKLEFLGGWASFHPQQLIHSGIENVPSLGIFCGREQDSGALPWPEIGFQRFAKVWEFFFGGGASNFDPWCHGVFFACWFCCLVFLRKTPWKTYGIRWGFLRSSICWIFSGFGGHRFLGTPPASWLPGRATSNSAQGSSRGAGAPLRLCKSWERFSCLQKMTRTQEPTYPTKQEKEQK